MTEQEQQGEGYPVFNLRDMTERDRAWLYLKTLYGVYEGLTTGASGKPLEYELRCMLPRWAGKDDKCRHLSYLPANDSGFDRGVDYIFGHRDEYNVFNSILPKSERKMSSDACPYMGIVAIDIDGKGEQGALPGLTPLQSAASHFQEAIQQRHVPKPHMVVETRNGYHVYWLLDKPYHIGYDGGDHAFRQNVGRLVHWISGDPDTVNTVGQRAYSGPHADIGQNYRAATLRPVGSYNHKEKGKPKVIRLVGHNLNLSPRYSRYQWSVELLPPPRDPPVPDPDVAYADGSAILMAPQQRRRMTRRTEAFMREGCPPGGGFHALVIQAVSDFCHCNYTPEEAFGHLAFATTGEAQIEELRSIIFPAGGNGLRFGAAKWNTYVMFPDTTLERSTPTEQVERFIRTNSLTL